MINSPTANAAPIPWHQALNLRVASDPLEILTTINKMYLDRSPVLVWQNVGNMRILRNCFISDVDFANEVIALSPMGGNKSLDFKKEHTVYIRGNEKSILFKQERARFDGTNVIVDIPPVVRLYEKRVNPRVKLGYFSRHMMHFEKRINQTNNRLKEFFYPVYDLSVAGTSVCFNPKEQVYFNSGETILIHQLGDFKFPSPIEAQLIYIKKIEFFNDGHRQVRMKMGISFKRPIAQDFIRTFMSAKK
jgi:hypothetical protein